MKTEKDLREIIKNKIVILDGAAGTELQKRGMPAGACPELWAVEHADIQKKIHRDYIEAGADIIYTCTFGANALKLKEYGCSAVEETNRKLASIARETAGSRILVAGDIGPCGTFIKPFGELDFDEAVDMFKRQVKGLLDGGADLFVIETQMDIQEARAALLAVKELCGAYTIVTMTYELSGRTLNGTSPEASLITLQNLGADAVGCNCSSGPAEMLELIKRMKPLAKIPLAAKPNAGVPCVKNNRTKFPMGSAEFGTYAEKFALAGINFMGGCCGTSPAHIKELSEKMSLKKPVPPETISFPSLSSAREAVVTLPDSPLRIIGERINPTGKKKLQAELKEGSLVTIEKMAREQETAGADFLDVNAGMAGIDEKKTLLDIISLIAPRSSLPLVIDSPDPDTAESALRLYPGRALINSISGEREKLERVLPAAAKYGAMFILLPVMGNSIPKKAEERIDIVKTIYAEAEKYGFAKKDILVDGLVMAASADPEAAMETLKTIEWASKEGFGTVIGLSNISFGLPERRWLNASFLSMAAEKGLSYVIANPMEGILMNSKYAADLLTGRDKNGTKYISAFSGTASPEPCRTAEPSPEEKIKSGIINGIREGIKPIINDALADGSKPAELLENVMIPAIISVGDLYEKKEYFLPQLIAGAETMKEGFSILEPLLGSESMEKKGKILFATVEGDIHDIGKNIVILMMKNYGFEVIDLGKNVKAEEIIKNAKINDPDIIAMSALMTTTMLRMPEIIEAAKKENLKVEFMAGGAAVTEEWAGSIGAHYSSNGVEAVKTAEMIMKKIRKKRNQQ